MTIFRGALGGGTGVSWQGGAGGQHSSLLTFTVHLSSPAYTGYMPEISTFNLSFMLCSTFRRSIYPTIISLPVQVIKFDKSVLHIYKISFYSSDTLVVLIND